MPSHKLSKHIKLKFTGPLGKVNIYKRIYELRKDGFLNRTLLTKRQKPDKTRTHWDYLLQGIKSVHSDFVMKRYLRKATTREISRMILKHFRSKKRQAAQAEKEQKMHLKQLALKISKMITVFWADIQKIVTFKNKLLTDEKQKKLFRSRLNIVVNQAETFLLSLTQDLNRNRESNGVLKTCHKKQDRIHSVAFGEPSCKIGAEMRTGKSSGYIKVPFLLKHQLREYQHSGLMWLAAMHEKEMNGILADEMGLGKTIQTIALLAHLACEKGIWGPHLIVVPTSVMLNWELEFKRWCPGFKILVYYGSQKERHEKIMGWTRQNAFHICITSYKLAVKDYQTFCRKLWTYLILDEAHYIKNFKTQCWQTLLKFHSDHRLLLTGTPLQNNLSELWSLMHFIMPKVFRSQHEFQHWFVKPVDGMVGGHEEYDKDLIKRLHKVLRPFILRRLKCQVEKQLPKKYEHIIMCKLSKRQQCLYDEFMAQTRTKEVLASRHFLSVIGVLMQLRKVCNHPNIFEPRPIVSPFMMDCLTFSTASIVWGALDYNPLQVCLSTLNLSVISHEVSFTAYAAHRLKKYQILSSFIESANTLPEKEVSPPVGKLRLIFGNYTPRISYPDYPVLKTQAVDCASVKRTGDRSQKKFLPKYKSPSQQLCSVAKQEVEETNSEFYINALAFRQRQKYRQKFQSLGRVNSLRCAACPLYGKDLVESASFCKQVQPRNVYVKRGCWPNYLNTSVMQQGSSEYLYCTENLSNIICSNAERYIKELEEILRRFAVVVPFVTAPPIQLHVSHPPPSKLNAAKRYVQELKSKLSPLCVPLHPIISLTSASFPDPRLIEHDCGKLQALASLLHKLKMGDHRALIFTQMTRMLDILEQFLCRYGYSYLRLDGTTKVDRRQFLVERFNVDKKIFCFILSTRSGCLGVNLKGADTVIFYDSDWNPTMDAQAQDRCHRIGQTREVHIYRLISEKTVEENILRKANQKRLLGDLAIEDGNFTTAFFKKASLHELFELKENNTKDLKYGENSNSLKDLSYNSSQLPSNYSTVQFEQALGIAEEEPDLKAAVFARNEAAATYEEFEESELLENIGEKSLAEEKFAEIMRQLIPVEKYAVNLLVSLESRTLVQPMPVIANEENVEVQ